MFYNLNLFFEAFFYYFSDSRFLVFDQVFSLTDA